MAKVDWSYHRKGCVTCGRTQAFLEQHGIAVQEQADAKKAPLLPDAALALVKDVDQLYATRGKKVVHIDLKKEQPDQETLASLLIGPSGKLRAPTLRKGRTLIVGFDEETYQNVFGV